MNHKITKGAAAGLFLTFATAFQALASEAPSMTTQQQQPKCPIHWIMMGVMLMIVAFGWGRISVLYHKKKGGSKMAMIIEIVVAVANIPLMLWLLGMRQCVLEIPLAILWVLMLIGFLVALFIMEKKYFGEGQPEEKKEGPKEAGPIATASRMSTKNITEKKE